MSCFNDLLKLRFFANASEEFKQAQEVGENLNTPYLDYVHVFEKKNKASHYDYYVAALDLEADMISSLDIDEDIISSVETDSLFFAYSKNKKLIENTIKAAFNVHGYLPLYTKKHKLLGKIFHTVLIDMRMIIPPASTN